MQSTVMHFGRDGLKAVLSRQRRDKAAVVVVVVVVMILSECRSKDFVIQQIIIS